MTGRSVAPIIRDDTPIHSAGIFGYHGAHLTVTDGTHVYQRAIVDRASTPNQYTLEPGNMNSRWPADYFHGATLAEPFPFTKGAPVLRCQDPRYQSKPTLGGGMNQECFKHLLWNIDTDPHQMSPLNDPHIEQRMIALMIEKLREAHAPEELFPRYGLT